MKEPFNDSTVSHGLCKSCTYHFKGRLVAQKKDDANRKKFFHSVWDKAFADQPIDATSLIQEARNLNIADSDLLMGLLQPILLEIGNHFEKGTVSVELEHRFSNMVVQLIQLMDLDRGAKGPVTLLLLNAHRNTHIIGPHFLKARLKEYNLRAQVEPAKPIDESLKLILSSSAPFVGVSLSLESQLPFLRELASRVNQPHRLFAGGPFFQDGRKSENPNLYQVLSTEEFIEKVVSSQT